MVADLPQSRGGADFSCKSWGCRLPLKVVGADFPKSWGAYFPQVVTKSIFFLAFLLLLFLCIMPMSLSCSSSMLSGSSWFCAYVFIYHSLTQRLLEGKCWPLFRSSCGRHVLSVILHFCFLAFLLSCSFVLFSFAFLFLAFYFFTFMWCLCVVCCFLLSSCAMFGCTKFL